MRHCSDPTADVATHNNAGELDEWALLGGK